MNVCTTCSVSIVFDILRFTMQRGEAQSLLRICTRTHGRSVIYWVGKDEKPDTIFVPLPSLARG